MHVLTGLYNPPTQNLGEKQNITSYYVHTLPAIYIVIQDVDFILNRNDFIGKKCHI